MATWTAGTALGTGALISQAWVQNVVNAQKFLAANDATYGKDLCQMQRTTSSSLTASTWTAVSFDAEDFDVANGHDLSASARYTAKAPGKYRLTAAITFNYTVGTPTIAGIFRKNASGTGITGAITGSYTTLNCASSGQNTLILATTYVSLAATNWVDVAVWCNGSGITIDPNVGAVQMAVEWVGAP